MVVASGLDLVIAEPGQRIVEHHRAVAALLAAHESHKARRLAAPLLVAVLAYTLARKDLGRVHAPRHRGRRQAALASAIGG